MRNYLYKLIIDDVTYLCYKNCLNFFPDGSRILDVGIGNGIMVKNYHDLIKSKALRITGIDINNTYLSHCRQLIKVWGLEDNIQIRHASVEEYEPPEKKCFDYILFSMSFMLFPDQQAVLDRVRGWLRPGGKVVFFQTMFKKKSLIMDFIKPRLKYVTSIDFGKVTYENEFFSLLDEKRISISEDRLIKREWFKGEYRMIVSSPEGNI